MEVPIPGGVLPRHAEHELRPPSMTQVSLRLACKGGFPTRKLVESSPIRMDVPADKIRAAPLSGQRNRETASVITSTRNQGESPRARRVPSHEAVGQALLQSLRRSRFLGLAAHEPYARCLSLKLRNAPRPELALVTT